MESFSVTYAAFIFSAAILIDVAYVFYVRRIASGSAVSSAIIASVVTFLGAVLVVSYTENRLYIAPLILGSFAGTLIAVRVDVALNGGRGIKFRSLLRNPKKLS